MEQIKREQIEDLSLCEFLKDYYGIVFKDKWSTNSWNFACESTSDGYEIWVIYDEKGKLNGGIQEAVFYEEDGLVKYFFENLDEFQDGVIYALDVEESLQDEWDGDKEYILENLGLIEEEEEEEVKA